MEDVSNRLGSVEHQLLAIASKDRYYYVCNPNLEEQRKLVERGLAIYDAYQEVICYFMFVDQADR